MKSIASLVAAVRSQLSRGRRDEILLEAVGRLLSFQIAARNSPGGIQDHEFRIYSQWGDDGIIQWLTALIDDLPRSFIEFGVEDFSEANTRFLMVNNVWRGLVMDGSQKNIESLKKRDWYWRYDLTAVNAFVTRENINDLISGWAGEDGVGLLHIDIDGNDYWIWDAISCITPVIVIVEYNALFGAQRPVSIPYDPGFDRRTAHYSHLYAGASLAALNYLGARKGYALIGTNRAGNNAYFVRRDRLTPQIRELNTSEAFTPACFRESRDPQGNLSHGSSEVSRSIIAGLPVINVETGAIEQL